MATQLIAARVHSTWTGTRGAGFVGTLPDDFNMAMKALENADTDEPKRYLPAEVAAAVAWVQESYPREGVGTWTIKDLVELYYKST